MFVFSDSLCGVRCCLGEVLHDHLSDIVGFCLGVSILLTLHEKLTSWVRRENSTYSKTFFCVKYVDPDDKISTGILGIPFPHTAYENLIKIKEEYERRFESRRELSERTERNIIFCLYINVIIALLAIVADFLFHIRQICNVCLFLLLLCPSVCALRNILLYACSYYHAYRCEKELKNPQVINDLKTYFEWDADRAVAEQCPKEKKPTYSLSGHLEGEGREGFSGPYIKEEERRYEVCSYCKSSCGVHFSLLSPNDGERIGEFGSICYLPLSFCALDARCIAWQWTPGCCNKEPECYSYSSED